MSAISHETISTQLTKKMKQPDFTLETFALEGPTN